MRPRELNSPASDHPNAQPRNQHAARGGLEQAAGRTPALTFEPSGPSSEPGAVEYASWLALLRPAAQ